MATQSKKYTIRHIENQVHVTDSETGWGKSVVFDSPDKARKLALKLEFIASPMAYIEAIIKSEDYQKFMREERVKAASTFWGNEYREGIKEGYSPELSEKYATENTSRYFEDVKVYSKIK